MPPHSSLLLVCLVALLCVPSVSAFGAGNIASVSNIEGHNWRHGDIEDLLTTVAFIRGHKWTSMMVKRVYFGNWLRDYSQAVDVGTLKGVQADTIRVLVWVLAFMSFGYATEEFEVTAERLGCYRPEEHIDNPKDYADNQDARKLDPRLRGPVDPMELAVDPNTGMKNYIANERGGWATSLGYIKYSFARSIHFGRLYTHGANKGREEDLCEALRCLGQGLHCVEDFGAHSNYIELALREMGLNNVFPHVGAHTMINLHGKQVYPLTTGVFGSSDFIHSVIGEANDHITQTEVNESEVAQLNSALSNAAATQHRGFADSESKVSEFTRLLSSVPGTGGLIQEALDLQAASDAQARENAQAEQYGSAGAARTTYNTEYDSSSRGAETGYAQDPQSASRIPGLNTNIDPQAAIAKIYPILAFRDKVVRTIAGIVSKIPGLERLVEKISETVTLFVMGLLAPFVKPIIATASNALKTGSGTVVDASAKQQFLVWTDPTSSDPTHSMLAKDHFSNVLNAPAGKVAGAMLQYVAPRVIYGWDHPEVPEHEILEDVGRCFHHPAARDHNLELHRNMFSAVERWAHERPGGGRDLNDILSSESVKAGKNHQVAKIQGSFQGLQNIISAGTSSHSPSNGSPFAMLASRRDLGSVSDAPGPSNLSPGPYGQAGGPSYEPPAYTGSGYPPPHGYPGGGQYGSGEQYQQPGPSYGGGGGYDRY